MNETNATLNIVLANTFVMYYKAHAYHWNVEGINFAQHHGFFGDLYEELHDVVDTAAEELRAQDEYAPVSIVALLKSATIAEDEEKPATVTEMFEHLSSANAEVVNSLNKLFEVATAAKKQGLADFAAGRLDVHAKHGWMIRSHLKG
jgi:starvation-inducible DNA-binding protein